MTWSRIVGACVLIVCGLSQGVVFSQPAGAIQVDTQGRWSEQAYGMSLAVPTGSSLTEQTADGALVKFLTQDPATVSVYIRRSQNELNLPGIKDKAVRELGFRHPSAVTLAQDGEPVTVAGRAALGLYLAVPDAEQGDWVFGQVYTLIDPTTVAVYQLNCNASEYDTALKTFQQLVESVQFADPAELDRIRTEQIEAGRAWLESMKSEKIKSSLIDEQWLRITLSGKDVGYMRIRHTHEADHVPPGIGVAIQSRFLEGDRTYDTEGTYFEASDRSVEFWTLTTTLRLPKTLAHNPNAPPQPDTQNWRQTGLRDGNAMEVSQETPTNIKQLPWKIPPYAYLSQVNQYVLMALLPREQPSTLAFYSFDGDTRKLSLRTYRIEPLPGGSYRVIIRPTPDQAEQVATFSPTGRLIERRMPDGRVYLATTPQELKRIWGTL